MTRDRVFRPVAVILLGCASWGMSGCGGGGDSDDSGNLSVGGSLVEGERLFGINCALCHGATGAGDGPGATGLTVKPRNLNTERYKYVAVGDHDLEVDALVEYLQVGRIENGMPSYAHLTEFELASLALFVESLRPMAKYAESPADEESASGPSDESGEG